MDNLVQEDHVCLVPPIDTLIVGGPVILIIR